MRSHDACTASATRPVRPSIVVMLLPSTAEMGVTHERVGAPFTCTVHAPHSAAPQPNLVPVIARWSRRAQSRGVSGAASTDTALPLIVRFAIWNLRGNARARRGTLLLPPKHVNIQRKS